jgi:hypothetical protein
VPVAIRPKPVAAVSPERSDVGIAARVPVETQSYFLVIDERFSVPIFVFLESDPRTNSRLADPGLAVRRITLDLATPKSDQAAARGGASVRSDSAIGRDPERLERFREFLSERQLRAARFVLIEPRYVGPSWETYLGVFRPEGEGRTKHPSRRRPADIVAI